MDRNLDALEKLRIARYRLIEQQPFMGFLAMSLKLVAEPGAPYVAATDGVRMYFNPALIEDPATWGGWSQEAFLRFLLAHEAMHLGLGHFLPSRIGPRDRRIWNLACDLVIHNGLREVFGRTPPTALYDASTKGMIEEEVYEVLRAGALEVQAGVFGEDMIFTPEGGAAGGDGGEGNGDEGGWGSTIASRQSDPEGYFREMVTRADSFARLWGHDPRRLFGKVLEEVIHPPLPWRVLLRRFTAQLRGRGRADWCRPNKRLPFYWPSRARGWSRPRVLVGIDASGSIGDQEYGLFLGELRELAPLIEADYLVFDTEEQLRTKRLEELKRRPCQGGTSYRPVWEALNGHQAVIILTDGYAQFMQERPRVPVFWAMTTEVTPPYGWVGRIRQ
jgi:predicted metal-dependent peptidase